MRRAFMLMTVLACGACSACSQSSTPPATDMPAFRSGARLRARVLRTEAGSAWFEGWWDSALGIPCAFRTATDGVVRCLPAESVDMELYTDVACTLPAYLPGLRCGATALTLALGRPIGGDICGRDALDARYPAYEVAEPVARVYTWTPSCGESPAHPPGTVAYALRDVDPTRFVGARLDREPRGARLVARVVVAEDGAREVIGFEDTLRAERCEPAPGPFGGGQCVPIEPAIAYSGVIPWMREATCTTAIAHGGSVDCPRATVVLRAEHGACGTTASLLEPGPEIAGRVYRGRDATRCDPIDRPDEVFYELGPPVAEDAFVRIGSADLGEGRTRIRYTTLEDGTFLDQTALVDAERGSECTPVAFADGVLRCIPTPSLAYASSYELVFADATCTEQVVELGGVDPTCPEVALPEVLAREGPPTGCSTPIGGLSRLEPIADGPRYQIDDTATCVPRAPPASPSVWLRVSADADPGAFPTLVSTTE